ncbi:MAG: hypothetical protein QOI25_1468 [Mycobacterium sp.]|nr:hypothetical protein [Mycobacterium sp.]MDT5326263.1 hypothetical protein [Mycobacterium sp.]
MVDTERVVVDAGSAAQWEQWLELNHDTVTEVWLRLFNKSADDVPLSYAEAVEIALCFGWIDSLARGYDDVSRIQRFSPRKPKSAWSKSNVERVQRLVAAGRMRESGQRQIDAAKADGRWPER